MEKQDSLDRYYMSLALEQAHKASACQEIPIGAVAVFGDQVVGRGYNLKETLKDPTAHAEVIALRDAAAMLNRWRLTDVTLYVTVEPCVMCAGAMIQSRLGRLVYAARDPKGASGSEYHILQDFRLNHQVPVTGGVLEKEASLLLKDFFSRIRSTPFFRFAKKEAIG